MIAQHPRQTDTSPGLTIVTATARVDNSNCSRSDACSTCTAAACNVSRVRLSTSRSRRSRLCNLAPPQPLDTRVRPYAPTRAICAPPKSTTPSPPTTAGKDETCAHSTPAVSLARLPTSRSRQIAIWRDLARSSAVYRLLASAYMHHLRCARPHRSPTRQRPSQQVVPPPPDSTTAATRAAPSG